MSEIVSFFIIITISILSIRLFLSKNVYEKILSFYFIFTNIIILILFNSIASFEVVLDIIIMLFLLKLVAVLFLLFNRKKI